MMPNDRDRHRPRGGRAALAFLLVGLLAWTAAASSLDSGRVGLVLDDGIYLASAQGLRDGEGYGLPSRPGSPLPKYPVGLPAAIALALRLAPGEATLAHDVAVARGLVLASGWIFGLAAFAWLRRLRLAPCHSALIVLATLFHHVALVGCASTIFADLPFCAVSYLLLMRWAAPGRVRDPLRRSFGDGLLAGAAILLRGNGITLVIASLAASALGPRRPARLVWCVAGLAAILLPASVGFERHGRRVPSGDYALELRAGWSSAASGLRILGESTRAMALRFPSDVVLPNLAYTAPVGRLASAYPSAAFAVRVGVSALVALGALRLARAGRRRDWPAWLHVAGTLAIFAVWPWTMLLDRFLLCLFPMTLLAFGVGVGDLARRLGAGRRTRRRLAALALALAFAGSLSVAIRSVMVARSGGTHWRGTANLGSLALALEHVRTGLEPDAVVAAGWPETVFLDTGRQAVPLVEDDDVLVGRFGRRDRLLLWMAECRGRPFYLLIRDLAEDPAGIEERQAAALAADPSLVLRPVFRTPDGRYRIEAVTRR